MNPEDIFLWPDSFWCFRVEFRPEFLRDYSFRVIMQDSEEWLSFERNSSQRVRWNSNRIDDVP